MAIQISNNKSIDVFAMIVDINSYAKIVLKSDGHLIAQFIRDILIGGVNAIQKCGGEVAGFMGDAFFAILSDPDEVFRCCALIAKDVNNICEFISSNSEAFPYSPTGISLKIGIEYGSLDVSTISSNFLGEQKLFTGEAINYAARITAAGKGNRCLIGKNAYEKGLSKYIPSGSGPYKVKGKPGEPIYQYYKLDLGDIWIENGSSKNSYHV